MSIAFRGIHFTPVALLLAAAGCASSVPSGDPAESPNRVTATLDGHSWTSTSVTPSFTSATGVFKIVATDPGDSLATELKLILVRIPRGPGTYSVIDTTGSEDVTLRTRAVWGTGTASNGNYTDGLIVYPTWGTVTFTHFDAHRAIGTFTINPLPHHTSGSFDVDLP